MDRAGIDRKVDELAVRCRDRGMNVTPQRMAIYRALLEADDHPKEGPSTAGAAGMPSMRRHHLQAPTRW
jgi:hypothetical protein